MRLETFGVAYIISTRMYCFETQNPEMNEKERYEGRGRGRGRGRERWRERGEGGEIEGGGGEEEGEKREVKIVPGTLLREGMNRTLQE